MTDQEIRLKFGEMNAGEMRLARALVEWHEREITKLKEDLTHAERWRDKLDTKLTEVVEAAERAGWDGVENSKNLPTFITYLAEALSKAQAELAALRQPILADDGRSLGRVAFDKYTEYARLRSHQQCLELVAQKVAAVVLAQAVRRMEAVPVRELWDIYRNDGSSFATDSMGAVRARLIAAAKGEGQAVVVNESPQDERQPDLSGENEKQAEPATFEAHGYTWTRHTPGDPMPCDGEAQIYILCHDNIERSCCVTASNARWDKINSADIIGWRYADEPAQPTTSHGWTPAVGDVVRLKSGGPAMTVTDIDPLSLMCAWMNASNELQIEPITTLCLEPAKP